MTGAGQPANARNFPRPARTDPVVVTLVCEASERIETERIDRAEWNAMTPTERAKRVHASAAENMNDSGGYGWNIADESDAAMVGDLPGPADVDEVLRLVEEYGHKRAAAATHGAVGYKGALRALTGEAADLLAQIRAAVAR